MCAFVCLAGWLDCCFSARLFTCVTCVLVELDVNLLVSLHVCLFVVPSGLLVCV